MDYDRDQVDEMTLALLYLVMSRGREGGRASKGFDLETMHRLYVKGWILEPKMRDMTVGLTPEGARKSEEFFRRHFERR